MSQRYKGAVISATPPTTTGGYSGTAPGSWTLQQQLQAQAAGNWPAQPRVFVEDVFSTYLYTGTGADQTITNNIALTPLQNTGGSLVLPSNSYARFASGTINLTGDFTFECFVKPSTTADMMVGSYGVGGNVQILRMNQGGGLGGAGTLVYYSNGTLIYGPSSLSVNQWNHVAITRSGSTLYILCNGSLVASGTFSSSFDFDLIGCFAFGGSVPYGPSPYYFNGSISSLRVINGTALYTSNYTVPTQALTLVSGTVLLTFLGANPYSATGSGGFSWSITGSYSTSTDGPIVTTPGYGGMVWVKSRSNAYGSAVVDTARPISKNLETDANGAAGSNGTDVFNSFTNTGFVVGPNSGNNQTNISGATYASWTFRKQEKFFDVVTWTGDGTNNRQISHALGSTPGCIIVKETNQTGSWYVYHISNGTGKYMVLNSTNAVTTAATYFPSVSSTTFTPTSDTTLNTSAVTYVAYLFANDAGGFGNLSTDNVISCGSFTTDSSGNASVNLGWEPQWVLTKMSTAATQWVINDNMRGMPASQTSQVLYPSLSAAESSSIYYTTQPNATGFTTQNYAGQPNNTVIYIAIRRGPMKTPTSGTSVFNVVSRTGNGTSGAVVDAGFPVDLAFIKRNTAGFNGAWEDRLRGNNTYLSPNSSDQEYNGGNTIRFTTNQNGVSLGTDSWVNSSGQTYFNFFFRRAAGFFDEVVTPGIGSSNHAIPHNLGVVPELIIAKDRNYSGANWVAYSAATGQSKYLVLNLNNAAASNTNIWGSSAFTSSTFYVNDLLWCATTGDSGVFYLFASCPGVSKVGSYTGTGGTQTISCGFAARWVMIKRTDSTGDWWYWDTTRGMVSGTDPRLAMNTNDAQTNADWVYTNASGFQIVTTDATVNASGGSYIYLAIA